MKLTFSRLHLFMGAVMIGVASRADFTPVWQSMPCCADDVSVGVDGTVWIVGHSLTGNGELFRWNGTSWVKQEGLKGDAVAVDAQGLPWIVNHSGTIFRPSGGTWVKAPGGANDIAIGADGSVWICGYSRNVDLVINGDVFKWDGATWVKEPNVKGVHIAVAPDGNPAVVNTDGDIFKRVNGVWGKLTSGQAGDVGIGADGSHWITGTRPDGANHEVYRWNGTTFDKALGGEGTRIAVAPNGEPWLVNSAGDIFLGHLPATPPPTPVIDLAGFTVGATGVSVSVTTVTGATYFLDAKNTVDGAQWLPADNAPGSGGVVTLHDGRAPGAASFYRIRVTQP